MIKLFIGLGNPGARYEGTRHNIGQVWLALLAEQLRVTLAAQSVRSDVRAASLKDAAGTFWLAQSERYMNESGMALAPFARFYRFAPEEILVVHDELDLPPGRFKLKQGGGDAGHNGLGNLTQCLGSANYWRLRVGIGHPGLRAAVGDWVLSKPPAAERQGIEENVRLSLAAFADLRAARMEAAMRSLHTLPALSVALPR